MSRIIGRVTRLRTVDVLLVCAIIVDYAIEVTYLWMVAANQRRELILSELSALI
jgi:hypothetical protein